MDPKFLEFWGNALIDAARGQQQLVQLKDWSRQGLKDLGGLSQRFAEVYGLPQPEAQTPAAADTWQAAGQQFQQAFKQFLNMLDVVPRSEHHALTEKYAALQAQAAEQQKIIQDLKHRLAVKGGMPDDPAEGFAELMRQQARQFQKLMKNFSHVYGPNSADENKK